MKSNFFKAMKAIERESLGNNFMQYDNTMAYTTENYVGCRFFDRRNRRC